MTKLRRSAPPAGIGEEREQAGHATLQRAQGPASPRGTIVHDGLDEDVIEALKDAAAEVHGIQFDDRLDPRLGDKIREWLRRRWQ
jgi:hypothetical protein